jgi:hypothetical protein
MSPLPLSHNDVITKNFSAIYGKEKSGGNLLRIHSHEIILQTFSVEIPSWMGFSRPQLTAVPGLFGWESLDGWDFLGHNLLLSQASFGGNPLMDGIF